MKYNVLKITATALTLIFAISTATAINAAIDNNRTYIPSVSEANIAYASVVENEPIEENDNSVVVVGNVKAEEYIEYYKNLEEIKTTETVVEEVREVKGSKNNKNTYTNGSYSDYEVYELAKIIMCEAEGESQKCKEYVGQVILNRIESKQFPNTIHDVIFDGIQFSPTFDGRWEQVEPNQDCYDAAYKVLNASEPLTDALFFEACKVPSAWHTNNLTKIATIDNTRFYI